MPAFEIEHEQEGRSFRIEGSQEKRWVDDSFDHGHGTESAGHYEVDIEIDCVTLVDQDGGEVEVDRGILGTDIEDKLRERFL